MSSIHLNMLVVMAVIALLAGCGGGGGSKNNSSASSSSAVSSSSSSQVPTHTLVMDIYQQVENLPASDLEPARSDALLARFDDISLDLESDEICAASDGVLGALDDIETWRNESGLSDARAAVLQELHESLLLTRLSVFAERAPGVGCGGGATVALDPEITPLRPDLPALDGGAARPLAAMVDAHGVQTDFVENEILIVSSNSGAAAEFAERWSGVVVDGEVADDGSYHSLIRVDPAGADPERLRELIAALKPGVSGAVAVSSDTARRLLALAALEASEGVQVGINFVGAGDGVPDGETADAPEQGATNDFGWTDDGSWSANAFDWIHYKADSVQGIGVPEAWQLLESRGLLVPGSVSIGLVDMGFRNVDMPSATIYRSTAADTEGLGTANRYTCGGGRSCPWHGTMVAQAAGGRLDNNFGAAGTGAPVARLVNVFTLYDAWSATIGITTARNNGASVISMSFGSRVPSIFDWGVGPSRIYTENLAGPVLLAAAGNSGEDVDGLECFLGSCWEAHLIWPCESERVICVGGLAHNSLSLDSRSNYGRPEEADNTVDIFAPFTGLVAGNEASVNRAEIGNGTSYATPYVAGVVALIRAANPALSKDELTAVLMDTARTDSPDSPIVHRVVNAQEAVKRVLPPDITISGSVLNNGNQASLNRNFLLTASVFFDGALCPQARCPVSWSPTPQGGQTTSGATYRYTTVGSRILTATTTLPGGTLISKSVSVNIVNQVPEAIIVDPPPGAIVYIGESVNFSGYGLDANEGAGPGKGTLNTGCEWGNNPVTGPADADTSTQFGCSTSKIFTLAGNRRVSLRVTDPQGGASSWSSVTITVQEPPLVPGPDAVLTISAPNYLGTSYARGTALTFTMATPGNGNPPYHYRLRLTSYEQGSNSEVYAGLNLWDTPSSLLTYPLAWTPPNAGGFLLPHSDLCYTEGQWVRATLSMWDIDGNPGSQSSVMFKVLCELF